ncbi:hypothetical protein EW146_g10443 [Bondarzewia mesenterica]|uniref:Uncharacterized protein n=1 Tax=Bondarzewia mesenterica TaxID=1095465 RepID=A0A4S4L1V9_9AGAM|nr:hypothetical protein EW146_g10443 [Bondarzewia mesenterica]
MCTIALDLLASHVTYIGLEIFHSPIHRNWVLKYAVPHSPADAETWAAKTIILQLHVSLVSKENGPIAPRAVLDGRGCHGLYASLSKFLSEALLDYTVVIDIVSDLEWGSKADRLCAAAVVLTGEFDKCLSCINGPGQKRRIRFIQQKLFHTCLLLSEDLQLQRA